MQIGLMCNNLDIMKIHSVVVFVDIAGDLGVMVGIRNCSFVFGNAGFQRLLHLAVVYKNTVLQLMLYTVPDVGQSTLFCAFGHGNKLFTVFKGL